MQVAKDIISNTVFLITIITQTKKEYFIGNNIISKRQSGRAKKLIFYFVFTRDNNAGLILKDTSIIITITGIYFVLNQLCCNFARDFRYGIYGL